MSGSWSLGRGNVIRTSWPGHTEVAESSVAAHRGPRSAVSPQITPQRPERGDLELREVPRRDHARQLGPAVTSSDCAGPGGEPFNASAIGLLKLPAARPRSRSLTGMEADMKTNRLTPTRDELEAMAWLSLLLLTVMYLGGVA